MRIVSISLINLFLVVIPAILIPFIAGMGMLTTKTISYKARRFIGSLLLFAGIINLLLAIIASTNVRLWGAEIIGMILYYLLAILPIILGLIIKGKKELKEAAKDAYGAVLLVLSIAFFLFINLSQAFNII